MTIRLLGVPPRGEGWEEDVVCLCDPNGSYLREEEREGSRQIVVKGPMQGTLDDYARAVSAKLGRQMRVVEFFEMKKTHPHDVRCFGVIVKPEDQPL